MNRRGDTRKAPWLPAGPGTLHTQRPPSRQASVGTSFPGQAGWGERVLALFLVLNGVRAELAAWSVRGGPAVWSPAERAGEGRPIEGAKSWPLTLSCSKGSLPSPRCPDVGDPERLKARSSTEICKFPGGCERRTWGRGPGQALVLPT